MLRGLADVNVLVSAVISPGGMCARLVAAAQDGRWQLVASEHLLGELRTALGYKRMRRWVAVEDIDGYVAGFRGLSELLPDALRPSPTVTRDPKDDYLVALAKSASVDAIISGDVHLTELTDLVPPVVRPADFLAMIG